MCQGRIKFLRLQPLETHNTLASCIFIAHDARMWILTIWQGLSAGLRVQDSPLYRYPYRSAAEAFRGDAKRIGGDIQASLERRYEQ